MLTLTSLHVAYGKTTVLKDISLQVAAGEILALIGPNGAGKTTLIRSVSGTLPIEAGQVQVQGRDVTRLGMAEKAKLPSLESYFTVGLFSALDVLMEKELAELVAPLPLDQDILDALLKHTGDYGEALQCTLAYEVSDSENTHFKDLSQNDIFIANVEAVSWANMVVDIA